MWKAVFRKLVVVLCGTATMAAGIALSIQSGLGTSPISSVPNVLHLVFPSISVGTFTILLTLVFLLLQLLLLRSRFQPWKLLQVPLSIAFGGMIDLWYLAFSHIPVPNYGVRLLLLTGGILLLSLGVSLSVLPNLIMNAGEALVHTLADLSGKAFGNWKVIFDCTLMCLAAAISLLCFHTLCGVREGTLLTAVLTGQLVRFFSTRLKKPVNCFVRPSNSEEVCL